MKRIKLFEDFHRLNEKNEISKEMASKEMGTIIGKKLFKFESATQSSHTTYNYGEMIKWSDGTSEKGYTTDDYTLKMKGPWILLKSLKFDPSAIKQMEMILKPGAMESASRLSFDNVEMYVKTATGITSKKTEPYSVNIFCGNYVGGKTLITSSSFYNANKNVEDWVDILKKDLNDKAKKITGDQLVKKLFEEMISASSMMRTTVLHNSQSSRDQGIGSAASTKVSYKILKEYDFTEYVKTYGISSLKAAIDANTFWKGRHFKELTPEGIMKTDESWTDTYD